MEKKEERKSQKDFLAFATFFLLFWKVNRPTLLYRQETNSFFFFSTTKAKRVEPLHLNARHGGIAGAASVYGAAAAAADRVAAGRQAARIVEQILL